MFKIMKFCAIVLCTCTGTWTSCTCTCTWWHSTCYKTAFHRIS